MYRTIALVLMVLTALATPFRVHADSDRWTKIGRTTVSDRVERDVIELGARSGRFEAIRLEVGRRAVKFESVEVRYANGERQEIAVRERIPAGGHSRVIDLAGGERVVESILLVYDAQSLGGRSTVTVLGRT